MLSSDNEEMDVDEDSSNQHPHPIDYAALERELDEKYPDRPHNHSATLPFHVLFVDLFNKLNENKKKPTGPAANRRRLGPHSGQSSNPHEIRRAIIERFISRWRQLVGDDIYPAFRLIIPEKDRDRAMYGLKEKAIGKSLVKVMKIDKNSEDGFNLLNWKLPGQSTASRMAGDFAGRCFEVISKRPMRTEVGSMTIAEVNELLDRLAAAPREEQQLPILQQFYNSMNAEELMWLIRIILRQMKVGATEKTFLDLWHPDAETLFNISSSLRRVCWELHDPSLRLQSEERGVALMQCFQPQLAQFQMHSFEKMVEKMHLTEEDSTFWIEEKLDGERMQLHMMNDEEKLGGKRFGFWSRKAKDYTHLYGDGFHDENGSLTRHLMSAFRDGVENIILDGEMITWDPVQDAPVPFGHLKTAVIAEQRNPYAAGVRPLFRVFDILLLNDQPLTRYTLRDRRKALERSLVPVPRRFELHTYHEAHRAEEIEPLLRKVVEEASEGLVIKNPRSAYHLNMRIDDWMKVKPEYMTEFGESLDVLVVGGYYGSGKRGGGLSSFLCGLRVDESFAKKGKWNKFKCHSFCKVGGGFTANDYANLRHHTEGKWIDWDPKNPPSDFVELSGGDLQHERPDVWIKPEDSIIVEVKAASVGTSDQFRVGLTLRFPRFKRLRMDKTWEQALSIQEFFDLKSHVEKELKEKEFKIDDARKKRRKMDSRKKGLVVSGYAAQDVNNAAFQGPKGKVFAGLTFFIMTESTQPEKKSKIELEEMVKANGGKVVQTHNAVENTVCVAERRTVKVASMEKRAEMSIIKPMWLFDCIAQSRIDFAHALSEMVLPLEPARHLYFTEESRREEFEDNVDEFGDSYARDTCTDELRNVMEQMGPIKTTFGKKSSSDRSKLVQAVGGNDDVPGWMFSGTALFFDGGDGDGDGDNASSIIINRQIQQAKHKAQFAGATLSAKLTDSTVTHVVVHEHSDVQALRKSIAATTAAAARRKQVPRIVTAAWIAESWHAGSRLAEERFEP